MVSIIAFLIFLFRIAEAQRGKRITAGKGAVYAMTTLSGFVGVVEAASRRGRCT